MGMFIINICPQVLDACLEACGDQLSTALSDYQSTRLPDVKALIRLQVIGYPWQYKQAPVSGALWLVNFLFRSTLAKLLPSVFTPQVSEPS